jgi:hypothetical protein
MESNNLLASLRHLLRETGLTVGRLGRRRDETTRIAENCRTLYGIDTQWKVQPQMVEGHIVEEDGLTWALKLREGLRFHDNEPVLAAAALTAGVAPRLGRGADRANTLVFVGVADLSVLDPVMTGFRPTRNAAYLVFDIADIASSGLTAPSNARRIAGLSNGG